MSAIDFPEANGCHGAPKDSSEEHVKTIPSYRAQITVGPFDGAPMVVVAWRPSPAELAELNAGGAVFLSTIGGLPPHFLSTNFKEATII